MTTRKKPKTDSRWLNLKQAGEYMGDRSPDAVRMLLRRGRLPYVQDGKRILVDRLDIDRYMEQAKMTAA